MLKSSKLLTALTVLLASLFLAAPVVSYAGKDCTCTHCKHHHKHHSKSYCKKHCAESKDKDCMADCEGRS